MASQVHFDLLAMYVTVLTTSLSMGSLAISGERTMVLTLEWLPCGRWYSDPSKGSHYQDMAGLKDI